MHNINPHSKKTGSRSKPEQVIIIMADGVGTSLLQRLLDAGKLPGIEQMFMHNGKRTIDSAVTAFPSTTGPAHLPFLTGRFPGPCNIPGIRWFDPDKYRSCLFSPFRFRSYMGIGNFFLKYDMAPSVKTLFQEITDHATIAGNIRKGVRPGRDLTFASKVLHNLKSFASQDWRGFDRLAEKKLLQAVDSRISLIFSVFYGPDSNGHKEGPNCDKVHAACLAIDHTITDLDHLLRRQGRREKTLVFLVSDHGMSATHSHFDLHAVLDRLHGPCLAHPTIWKGFYRARSAVMVSGNAMAHIYLKIQQRHNIFLDSPDKTLLKIIDELLANPAVNQLIGRNSDNSLQVITKNGSAKISELQPDNIIYTCRGEDPFAYPTSLNGSFSDREMLEKTFNTDYPDAPRQLLQLFKSRRCGHLVVTSTSGHDLRAGYERPPHLGSHGSLHRDHMLVPLLCNRKLRDGARRTVDVFTSILATLDLPISPDIDGKNLFR